MLDGCRIVTTTLLGSPNMRTQPWGFSRTDTCIIVLSITVDVYLGHWFLLARKNNLPG